MKITKKIYCQTLTLNRLNLWLWTTAILLLGVIFQLEMTGAVSWIAVGLGLIFLGLATYLGLSSYVQLDQTTGQLQLHFPFRRQAFTLPLAEVQRYDFSKRTITVATTKAKEYRLWLSAKHVREFQKMIIQKGQIEP
ncbi:EbsA family protein [Lapidilactobacillus achengensis]|uniref:EbsA family protein n=1 Tax=Lapidilactobacillus achengensis TaxID=2486000 RepID=A0ABW1UQ48_9LACO|nr:EbsA family protein [Lapidilactobacillus achengensis]